MDYACLKQIVASGYSNASFSLSADLLQNEVITKCAEKVLYEASFTLFNAAPMIELGDGVVEVKGEASHPPFVQTLSKVHFFIKDGKAQFKWMASPKVGWSPGLNYDAFRGSVLDHIRLTDTYAHQLVLDSTAENDDLQFHLELDLEKMSAGFSSLVNLDKILLKGHWQPKENGQFLDAFSMQALIASEVDLKFTTLQSLQILFGGAPGYAVIQNKPVWEIVPYMGLKSKFTFKVDEKEYHPAITATAFNLQGPFRFEAEINNAIAMGVHHLSKLGMSDKITEVLPAGFTLEDAFSIDAFFVDVMPASSDLIESISVVIASKKTWELFNLPGKGEPLKVEQLALGFNLIHPLSDALAHLNLSGELRIGEHAALELNAIYPDFVIRGQLKDNETLSVSALAKELLGDATFNLPEGLLELVISQLQFKLQPKEKQFALEAVGSGKINFQQLKVGAALEMDVAYTAEAEHQYSGTFKGLLMINLLRFDYELYLGDATAFTATVEEVSLSAVLESLAGTSLPDGMPDLVARTLTLKLSDEEGFEVSGGFKVAGESVELGGKRLTLVDFQFHFKKSKRGIELKLQFSGAPQLEWIPDILLNSYALQFTYHREGEQPAAWQLGGDVELQFFQKRTLKLGAAYTSDASKKELALYVNALTQQPALEPHFFTAIEGISPSDSEALRKALQTDHVLDVEYRIAETVELWNPEYMLPLPAHFEQHRVAIRHLLGTTEAFFTLQVNQKKSLELTPKNIRFKYIQTLGERPSAAWELHAASDLLMYHPDHNDPVLTLRNGVTTFRYTSAQNDFHLDFKASEAAITIIDQNYKEAAGVNDKGEITYVDRRFRGLVHFTALKLERVGGKWNFSGEASLAFNDLPKTLSALFENSIQFKAGYEEGSLYFEAMGGLKAWVIPDLFKALKITLPEVGRSIVKLQRLRLTLGRHLRLSAQMGIGLPEKLNEALGFKTGVRFFRTWVEGNDDSLVNASLTIGTDVIEGKLENSPFGNVPGIDETDKAFTIDFQKIFQSSTDLGQIKIDKPQIAFDLTKGTLQVGGGYTIDEVRGVQLPLAPMKKFFEFIQLKNVADQLPDGIPIKSVEFTPDKLKDVLRESQIELPEIFVRLLDELENSQHKLPRRFTEYLSLRIPEAFRFSLDITPDGGVSIDLHTKGDPLQLLLPTPMGFVGFRIRQFAFGTALGGALLKTELSMEYDVFDYLTLGMSFFLFDNARLKPHLPERNALQRTVIIEDLLVFIVYQAGIPIPVPLFYKNLELKSVGPEGIEVHTKLAFPKPEVNLTEALTFLKDLKEFFTVKENYFEVNTPLRFEPVEGTASPTEPQMNLVLYGGPMYMRLPKYLSGGEQQSTFGITGQYKLLDALNLSKVFMNGMKGLLVEGTPERFVTAFHVDDRRGEVAFNVLNAIRFKANWIIATPKEFVASGYKHLELDFRDGDVGEIMAALPIGRGVPTDIKSALQAQETDEKGTVAFFGGAFTIGGEKGMHLIAAGGVALTGKGFGAGLLFRGRFGEGFMDIGLGGRFTFTKENLLVAGNGYIQLLGNDIIKGEYQLDGEQLLLHAEANMKPIAIKGTLEGTFNNEVVNLTTNAAIRFWGLEFEGMSEFHFTETEQRMVMSNRFAIGESSFLALKLQSELQQQSYRAGFSITGQLLNFVHADLHGAVSVGATGLPEVIGKTKLTVLEHEVMKGELFIKGTSCSISGQINLFPPNEILRLSGKLDGTFDTDAFQWGIQGQFYLRGIADIAATARLIVSQKEQSFAVDLKSFLGTDFTVMLSHENGLLKATTKTSGPISLLGNAIYITGSHGVAGPALTFEVAKDGLQTFDLDCGIRFLGVAATALKVSYKENLLQAMITHHVGGQGIFLTDYTFNGHFGPNSLMADTQLQIKLNIGKAIQETIKKLSKGWVDLPADVEVDFNLRSLKVRIDNKPNTDNRSEEERKRLEAWRKLIQQHLSEINERINRHLTEVDDQIKILEKSIETHRAELEQNPDPDRAAQLRESIKKLAYHINQLNQCKKELAELKKNLASVTKYWLKASERLETIERLPKELWSIAQDLNKYSYNNNERRYNEIADGRYTQWANISPKADVKLIADFRENNWLKNNHRWAPSRGHHAQEAQKNYTALIKEKSDAYYNTEKAQRELYDKKDELEGKVKEMVNNIAKAIHDSNVYMLSDQLNDKTELFHQQYRFDKKAEFVMPPDGQASQNAYADDQNRLVFELSFSFRLPMMNNTIDVDNLVWTVPLHGLDLKRPVLEQLPWLFVRYLTTELGGILGHAFKSGMALVKYLIDLITKHGDAKYLQTMDEKERQILLIRGMAECSYETAVKMWEMHQDET